MSIIENNVVREDVIKVGWDIDNPFQEIVDQANKMKQNLSGTFKKSADDLDNVADEAKKLKKPLAESSKGLKDVADELDKLKKAPTGMQNNIDTVNKSMTILEENAKKLEEPLEQAKEEAENLKVPLEKVKEESKKLKEPLEQFNKESEKTKKPLTDTNKEFNKMKSVLKNIKGMFSKVKDSIGNVKKDANEFKKVLDDVAKPHFDSIKSSFKDIGSTIAPILQKAKDFGLQLKNIASKPYKIVLQASDQLSGIVDNVKSKLFSLKNIITTVVAGATVKESVGMIVDLQNIQTQFETLLGSADKAQKRVDELIDFAGNTPFTREQIFAASKQLQVFTGDALSTGKGLKIVGDVAAGTGQEFEEVALWVGRLYDGMKSGSAVGEMTSRLQEMGAISGRDRKKIEELAEAGGDIKKNWAEVEKIFSRYDGLMEKQSKNLGNLLLGVKTFVKQNIFKKIGEGITQGLNGDGLQAFLVKFKNWRSENKALIDNMASGIKNTVGKISSFVFTRLGNLLEKLPSLIQTVKSKFNELKNTKLAQGAIAGFKNIVNFIMENKDKVVTAIQGIGTTLGGLAIVSKLKGILSVLKLLASPLGIVLTVGTALFSMLKKDSANGGTALTNLLTMGKRAFEGLKGVFGSAKEIFSAVLNAMVEIAPGLIDLFMSIAGAGKNILTSLDPSLKELFLQLVDTAKEVINAFLPVVQDVFGALLAVVKAILPFLLKLIKSIAKMVKGFAKAGGIEFLVKSFIAYKTVIVAITAALKIYNVVQSLMYVKSVLAAKGITLVQAAFKLLKLAMASHPIFMAATAIGLLVGVFSSLSKAMKDSNDPAEKVKEHIQEVTQNTKDFRQAIEDANPVLADYDKLISSKGHTMGDIDESIGAKENRITEVIRAAIREQRKLRHKDIENIRKYMNELQSLQEEKLSIYQGQQTAQISAMKLELKNGGIDTENISQITADAEEALKQTKSAISDVYSSKLTNIENLKTAGQLTKKQYNKQMQDAYDWKESQEKSATDNFTEVLALVAQKDLDSSSEFINKVTSAKSEIDKIYKQYDELYAKQEKGEISMDELNFMKDRIEDQLSKEIAKQNDILGNIKIDDANPLKQLFTTVSKIKENDGQIPQELQKQVDSVLNAFDNLPNELQESGKNILDGLVEGMVDSKGEAIKTSEMTAHEIIDAAKGILGINSPSTVFAEIGTNIMAGLRQGIIAGLPSTMFVIIATITSIIGTVRKFDLNSLSSSAKEMSNQVITAFSTMRTAVVLTLLLMKVQAIVRMTALSISMIAIFNKIKTSAVSAMQSMSSQVVNIIIQMKSSIMSVDLYSAGQHIMQGLENGMLSKKKSLINTAKSMANVIKSTTESATEVGSPSKVMYRIGEFIGLGEINGMKSTIPKIKQTAQNMSEATVGNNTNYTPENSSTSYTRNVSSENTNFAPVFNLTISGTNDDRTMARKVKQYVTDAMDDIFASYESKSGAVREV